MFNTHIILWVFLISIFNVNALLNIKNSCSTEQCGFNASIVPIRRLSTTILYLTTKQTDGRDLQYHTLDKPCWPSLSDRYRVRLHAICCVWESFRVLKTSIRKSHITKGFYKKKAMRKIYLFKNGKYKKIIPLKFMESHKIKHYKRVK